LASNRVEPDTAHRGGGEMALLAVAAASSSLRLSSSGALDRPVTSRISTRSRPGSALR
jgi:hypothetical protein